MKELVFVSGPNCPMSVEVEDKVILFESLNPEIKVTRLVAGSDNGEFYKKSNGYDFSSTPTFAALEDGKVLDIHEGRACEAKLLKMFSPEKNYLADEQDIESNSENLKIILFFASSWNSARSVEKEFEYNKMNSVASEFLKNNPEIELLKIDVETEASMVASNCYHQDIDVIPKVLLVKNNKFVKSYDGIFDLKDLENFIN
jgi:hypothetical protein